MFWCAVLLSIFTLCLYFDLPYRLVKIQHNLQKYSVIIPTKTCNKIYILWVCSWFYVVCDTLPNYMHVAYSQKKKFFSWYETTMSVTKFQGDKYGVIFLFLEMFTWSHSRLLIGKFDLLCLLLPWDLHCEIVWGKYETYISS